VAHGYVLMPSAGVFMGRFGGKAWSEMLLVKKMTALAGTKDRLQQVLTLKVRSCCSAKSRKEICYEHERDKL
jgi:hypothetical protein